MVLCQSNFNRILSPKVHVCVRVCLSQSMHANELIINGVSLVQKMSVS